MAAASLSPSELRELARGSVDHFERLGVPRRWPQVRAELEDAYVARMSLVHPDRYVGEGAAIASLAQQACSLLNSAYKVLRDPTTRAEYLVALLGIDLDKSGEGGAPMPDHDFLVEVLDRRDQLDDLLERPTREIQGQVERLRGQLSHEVATQLKDATDALEAGDPSAAAARLVRRRYVRRMLDQIDAWAEGQD